MIDYLKPLQALFEQHRNPRDAKAMEAYMKGHFKYFGIKSTQRRELQKQFLGGNGLPQPFDHEVFRSFWAASEREFQMAGLDILRRQAKMVDKADIALIEELITTKSWWDTVDGLSSWICGPYFTKFPEQIYITGNWAVSENMWLRRASILFQLGYKDKTDFELLKKHIELNFGSKEFFINKAIGWSLREYGKTQPELVIDYVDSMKEKLHTLSYREAMKNLG